MEESLNSYITHENKLSLNDTNTYVALLEAKFADLKRKTIYKVLKKLYAVTTSCDREC